MGRIIPLPDVVELAASGAYGGPRVLSPLTEAAIRCAGNLLGYPKNWDGAGDALTTEELDAIGAIVSDLQYEVSTEEGQVCSMRLIETIETTPAVASIQFSGLTGNYYILKSTVYSSSVSQYLRLFVNGGIDESDYFRQEESWRGSVVYQNGVIESASYLWVAGDNRTFGATEIAIAANQIVSMTKFSAITNPGTPAAFHMYDASITNHKLGEIPYSTISNIIVAASGANLIDIGSSFSLYELDR